MEANNTPLPIHAPLAWARAAIGLSVLALTGCVMTEKPWADASSTIKLPEVWASAARGNEGKISTGWVKSFSDRQMSKLIDEALTNNHDLKAASARLRQAKEGTILGRAARFPTLGIGGSSNRSRRIEDVVPMTDATMGMGADTGASATMGTGTAMTGMATPAATTPTTTTTVTAPDGTVTTTTTAVPATPAPTTTPAPMAPVTPPTPVPTVMYSTDYGLSLDASWEMDLWGRLRDLDHAAYADFEAAQADFRSARLSLAANAAKGYFDLITAQQQFDLAQKTKESFERNYRITERNYKAGDDTASPLDVQFGRNNVASAERDLVGRKLARDEAARALEVLLGRYPSADVRAGDELPNLKRSVPAGLPSELLMRRPDLAAAGAAVKASAKRADAARKDLLPSFRLTAGGSTSSPELGNMLIDPEQIVWNVATSIAQPVFEGGSLRAQARRALAQNEEQIRLFAAAVLRALREVESALATERSLSQQEAFLTVELKQANLAENQAGRDYAEGIVQILSVLEAQRRAVQARNSMIALKNQRLQNRVDLHLALGGDFKTSGGGG